MEVASHQPALVAHNAGRLDAAARAGLRAARMADATRRRRHRVRESRPSPVSRNIQARIERKIEAARAGGAGRGFAVAADGGLPAET
jgi:hypothetical protein